MILSPRSAVLAAVLFLALLGCGEDAADTDTRAVAAERTIEPVGLDTTWVVGGTVEDSLLLMPMGLASGGGRAYLLDGASHRVLAFDAHDGRLAWSFGGRGGGPRELDGPTALALLPQGDVVVADPRNARLTVVDGAGELRRHLRLDGVAYVQSLCGLGAGRILLATLEDQAPLRLIDGTGARVSEAPLPWQDLRGIAPIVRQAILVPGAGGACTVALTLGRGFARFRNGSFDPPRAYVERMELPVADVQESRNARRQRLERRQIATLGGHEADGEVCFLFVGSTRDATRLLDCYGAEDGGYRRSLRLPLAAHMYAREGDTHYFLTRHQGYPQLIAGRMVAEQTRGAAGL